MIQLTANEIAFVSGGHEGGHLYDDVPGWTRISSINGTKDGVRGHYDVYRTSGGSTVTIFVPGTVVNTDTGALEPA